jgi:L-alanine-DL-glutamate epimerase-like enolase superfamily enzyme
MRIESYKVRVVHPEGLGFRIGTHLWVDQMMVLLSLRTDEGVTGTAGTTTYGPGYSVAQALHEVVAPMLLGGDPFERERYWQDLFRRTKLYLSPQAIAVADCALWDIAGQILGLPVHRLLGTYRTSLRAYASTLTYPDIPTFLTNVEQFLDNGFKAIKLHVFGDADKDIELCTAVRKLAGAGVALMIDASGHYDMTDALRVGRALEDLGYEWLEMPIEDPFIESYATLARHLDIAITTGELTANTFPEAASAIARGAWDIIRIDAGNSGGITGARKTVALAEAFGLRCELHSWGFVVNQLSNLHVMCASSNSRYFEMPAPIGLFDFGLEGIPLNPDGSVTIPDRPGLGQVFDDDAIEKATTLMLTGRLEP